MALTSLGNVKTWLNITTTDSDVLLKRLIDQVSGATLNRLERPALTRRTYTELRSGVSNQRLVLRNWPVISIASLTVDGVPIPAASSPTSAGYTLATWDGTSAGIPQEITLRGYWFCRGLNNVSITYDAGYCVQSESNTVPASTPYIIELTPSQGAWAQDDGIKYANGTAFTAVAANIAPAIGQYNVINADGVATYTFNSADANASILISYSFIPSALEQAVIEWIGERYKYKDRIGQSSKSLGGNETAAYSLKGIPDYIDIVFAGYAKFLPL